MLCSFPSKHTDHFFFLSCLMLFLAEVTHPPGPLFTAQGSLSQAEYTGRVPMWRASARVPCCSSTNNPRDTVAATAEEVRGFKLQLTNCCISSTLGQNKQKKNATHNTRQPLHIGNSTQKFVEWICLFIKYLFGIAYIYSLLIR